MATAAKKTAAAPRKAAAKKAAGPIVWEGDYDKETDGTHVFKESGPRADWKSGSIYVRKSAAGDPKPSERCRVTIEFI
jgi:hypothetical protein